LDSVPQRRRAVDCLIPFDGRKISRTREELRGKSRRETTFRCSPWYDRRRREGFPQVDDFDGDVQNGVARIRLMWSQAFDTTPESPI